MKKLLFLLLLSGTVWGMEPVKRTVRDKKIIEYVLQFPPGKEDEASLVASHDPSHNTYEALVFKRSAVSVKGGQYFDGWFYTAHEVDLCHLSDLSHKKQAQWLFEQMQNIYRAQQTKKNK